MNPSFITCITGKGFAGDMVLHQGYSACLRLGSQGSGSEIKISV